MAEIQAWFERSFPPAIAVELLPNLLTRLRGTPARLNDAVAGVSRDLLICKPDGKWSAQEHVGHLIDLEPLWLARVEDYVRASVELTPTDLANRRTHEAGHNGRAIEELLAGFRIARARLLDRVRELDPGLSERSIPHPRLRTPLRLIDHLHFVAEHDDHHLAVIWGLLEGGR
jgi:uncharacterized damage-inducible protein DinB